MSRKSKANIKKQRQESRDTHTSFDMSRKSKANIKKQRQESRDTLPSTCHVNQKQKTRPKH